MQFSRRLCSGRLPVRILAPAVALLTSPAWAVQYSWNDVDISLGGRLSLGAMWRMEERDNALVGKLNVPGQQGLCARDDCIDLGGDTEPNQRLVDAEGAFIGHAFDDGNLNYDQYDLTSALAKLNADLTVGWENVVFRLTGVGFYDAVNYDAEDRHPDTTHQPARTPRLRSVEEDIGADVDLLQAFVATYFDIGEHTVNVSVGKQILRWGESNLIALNSLSEINPPDENRLWMPGAEIREAYQPVALAVIAADLTQSVDVELFYQLAWIPAKAAAAGGFMSLFEGANGRDYFLMTQGQTPEDPNGEHRIAGLATLLTDSSATARIVGGIGAPRDDGQLGLRVNWYAEDFLGGTQLSLYAANYHSRVPYLSMIAGDDSCIRDSTNLVDAIVDCPLLASGSLSLGGLLHHYLGIDVRDLVSPIDIELSTGNALPFDTPKGFLDYPEDIHLFGASFNTTLGTWSLSGEYAYRPNMPVQVSLVDVIMAASQPLFPRQDIVVGLPQLATIPSARRFIPDFLSVYRGYDNSDPERSIQAGQIVRGFERLPVGQLDLTAIKVFSSSDIPFPLGAEQVILIVESGFTHIVDMPDKDELQLEGFILHKNTHASPGADGTGSGGVPDSLRLTPTQQTEGFADDFAWGYRISVMMEYNDVIFGTNFKPWLIWGHDVDGISAAPKSGYQGFAEGRRFFQIGSEFNFLKDWSGGLFYRGSTGDNDTMRDRDHLTAYIAYSF